MRSQANCSIENYFLLSYEKEKKAIRSGVLNGSTKNPMYCSHFSLYITKGFAVMRFSCHVLEVSYTLALFILMC